MVCPYCSTDMEPIELNGKVFCSNCGLTIKTLAEPTRLDPNASVVSGYKGSNSNNPLKDDFPAFPVEDKVPTNLGNMNPITDSAKEELGIEIDHSVSDIETLNGSVLETEEVPMVAELNSATTEQNPTVHSGDNPSEAQNDTYTNDIDNIVKTLSQAELQTHKPLTNTANAEQIKEIESLAAGGILLDILSDDLTHKESEAEVRVLDAAKKLVKHIKPADISEDKKTQEKEPESLSKEAFVDKSEEAEAVAEIKKIEEKIQNLEEKSFEISDKEIKKYDPDALDMLHLKIGHKTNRIVPNNNNVKEALRAAILPQNNSETTQPVNKSLQDNTSNDETGKNTDSQLTDSKPNQDNEVKPSQQLPTEPSMDSETTTTKPQTLKPKNKEHFSFGNIFKSNKPKKEKLSKNSLPKSIHENTNNKAERKSSHVSPEYFKKIIEINKAQKQVSKPTKHSKSKNKKAVKGKKIFFIYIFIGFIGFFVLLTAIFMIYNSTKPEAQIERAISSTTFNTKKPNYIPEGYILSGADFDKTKNIYRLEYSFATDKNRKIILEQTKQSEPADYINNLVKLEYKDKEFTQKTVAEQDYTEIAKYTILWNRAEMVYTIIATNTIMDNNLLYKMAGSIE